jgi:secreted trypsin-like serine protease
VKRILPIALVLALAMPVAAGAAPKAAPSVVGGRDALAEDWPSIAFLLAAWDEDGDPDLEGSAGCTGTVIKAEWILTAAHCGFGPDDRPVDAMLSITGAADYNDPVGEVIVGDRLVVHDQWSPVTLLGDAMLMHLEAPSSRPAMPLARAGTTYGLDPSVPNAAGWGLTDEAATIDTSVLQEAYLDIYDDADCRGYDPTYDANTQTCAYTLGVAGVCHGDSGGPLTVLDVAGVPHLWGITSYGTQLARGLPPCSRQAPAVFSWAPAFAQWIEEQTGAAPPPPPAADTPPTPPAPPPRDTTAPLLSRARLSTRKLRAARRGATISGKTGTKLSFTLSEAAAVRVTVLRRTRALAPSATIAGRAGRTTRTFTGRLGGKKLRPGRYRLQLGAVDVAGNAARPVRIPFRILR